MGNKIPQKSFDAQMHIIRDAHFDVDKYKVGELYVINNALKILDNNNELHDIDKTLKDFVDCEPILFQKNKVIGELIKADERSLTFKVLVNHPDPRYVAVYSYAHFTLSIDKILEYHIEIERLLTETESIVYLTSTIPKICAEDLIPKPIDEKPVLTDKYKGDLSKFVTPNSLACDEKYFHSDGTLKNIDMGAKQSTLDPKDPKFNRLLGIVPDHSQFPYTLEHTHSYQELQAAYKINTPEEAAEIAKDSQMNIVDDIMESAVDTNINRLSYICHIPGIKRGVSFIIEGGSFAYELFDRFEESIKVTLKSGETVISFRTSPKNITANENIISVRNGNCTIRIVLHKDSFYKIFDEIRFE